ncbi:phage tail fiber protein [Providencia sp. PROV129]|uniref:phage tail fiber protein n=1 Tax=Providencia sp. PROV129 TaxID=2949839 RepID=UPI003FA68F20
MYQLLGVLGLHFDASWGGINGGITIPCGINQLPLVYALYDVLEKGKPHSFDGRIVEPDEDGDIVLYTTYRKHDLPQNNIQYERFKLYPEFLRDATEGEESIPGFDGKVELTPGEPCDIPVGHWVDVRVNMPSNSIYNQKQAEAERLAKLEAERLAQEEAKRAAEEEERAAQETIIDENDTALQQ